MEGRRGIEAADRTTSSGLCRQPPCRVRALRGPARGSTSMRGVGRGVEYAPWFLGSAQVCRVCAAADTVM